MLAQQGMPLRNWVRYNAEKGGWDVKVTRNAPSSLRSLGGRQAAGAPVLHVPHAVSGAVPAKPRSVLDDFDSLGRR